jgi:hypothetical protein
MTALLRFELALPRRDVLGFLGYPAAKAPPARIEHLLEEALTQARELARPRGAFVELAVQDAARVGFEPISAERLVVGLVTAGDAIEESARWLAQQGRATEAVLMDAAGSAAAEEAANRLSARIVESCGESEAAAPEVPCRLSPGYGRWGLTSQRALFELLPHRELGIELLPSLLMVPRKSISFAIWLGATERPDTGLAGCAGCALVRCRYRRETARRNAR